MSVRPDPFLFLSREGFLVLLLFSLLFLAALPHAQFGQQNLDVCFSFPKSILISLPKRGTKQAEVITDVPQARGLHLEGRACRGICDQWRTWARLTDTAWNRCTFTAPQTCTETCFLVLPLSKPSAVHGSCSICTTCVIREHACSVGTSHLSRVPDWWLPLPCHVTVYSSTLAHCPNCPSVIFAPYSREWSVSVHFCLAESLNSNFFIILFCKRQTFLSDAFQLSSNRSFKTM